MICYAQNTKADFKMSKILFEQSYILMYLHLQSQRIESVVFFFWQMSSVLVGSFLPMLLQVLPFLVTRYLEDECVVTQRETAAFQQQFLPGLS